MKVNAGVRSVVAEAKVGELYPIPKYINDCTQQLKKKHISKSHECAHRHTCIYVPIVSVYHQPQHIKRVYLSTPRRNILQKIENVS